MSDNIMIGERFASFKKAAWHKQGIVFEEHKTAKEAVALADISFEVFKAPVYVQLLNEDGDAEYQETSKYVVMREPVKEDPEYRMLSKQWVGPNYSLISVDKLADILQPLTDGSLAETFSIETLGAIGHGETVFFTLKAGSAEIAGEEHDLYYLVTDNRDGTGSLNVAFTPVRVVCQNTLISGLSSAQLNVKLAHNANLIVDTEWYMSLFQQLILSKDSVINEMNLLAEVKASDDDVKSILKKAYRDASKPRRLSIMQGFSKSLASRGTANKNTTVSLLQNAERNELEEEYTKRQDTVLYHRRNAFEIYQVYNEEYPKIAGTLWSAWQAITEYEDHRAGHGDAVLSPVFGDRADTKARAFKAAYALATGIA